jgi:putative transposase
VDEVRKWSTKTGVAKLWFMQKLGIHRAKFYDWELRYGKVNQHNGLVPRDHQLLPQEREAIIKGFHETCPYEGYRSLTYTLMDSDTVAASPATVYRILREEGLITRSDTKPSKKGTGFDQPLKPHEHWHIDFTYIKIAGQFFFLCFVLDGYSRSIIHWKISPTMTEKDSTLVLQRAKELFPKATPRIISDNGKQFTSRDFKAFVALSEWTSVRTSPYYPQSNGKLERFHSTFKRDCWNPASVTSPEEAQALVSAFVLYYNTQRKHSSIGYVTPEQKLTGLQRQIFTQREQSLQKARAHRALTRKGGTTTVLAHTELCSVMH